MKKSILTTIALTLFSFVSFAFIPADTNKVSHNVKITASSVLDIQMTSAADVPLSFSTFSHYENGVTALNAAELKVKSTKPWNVSVSTSQTNFTPLLSANSSELAASALRVRKNGTNNILLLILILQLPQVLKEVILEIEFLI